MKRWTYRFVVSIAVVIYLVAIVYFSWLLKHSHNAFADQKDFIPLIVALPAAWLTYAFQARSSMSAKVREIWNKAAEAVEAAIAFVEFEPRTEDKRQQIVVQLRIAADYLRAVFQDEPRRTNRMYASQYVESILTSLMSCNLGASNTKNLVSTMEKDWRSVRHLLAHEMNVNAGWFFPIRNSNGRQPGNAPSEGSAR
jgi:hypothetical protein